MSAVLAADRRELEEWLEAEGIDVMSVTGGPRGTLKVSMAQGDADRERVPAVFQGRGVIVTFHDASSVARLGRSPALPDVVHQVKGATFRGGGWIAQWKCERGRGEVYGAELLTEVPEGAVMCKDCP